MLRTKSSLVILGAFIVATVPLHSAHAQTAAPAPLQAQPSTPPPSTMPPGPPLAIPAAPSAQPIEAPVTGPRQAPAPQPPAGQWVFTQQYGWLYLPYDQGYTHVVDDAALAYEYAYYPAFGWRWVVAPWVLGFGNTPYWGSFGPAHFAWYAHPWFRVGTAHLHPSWGRGVPPHPAMWSARRAGFGHGRR